VISKVLVNKPTSVHTINRLLKEGLIEELPLYSFEGPSKRSLKRFPEAANLSLISSQLTIFLSSSHSLACLLYHRGPWYGNRLSCLLAVVTGPASIQAAGLHVDMNNARPVVDLIKPLDHLLGQGARHKIISRGIKWLNIGLVGLRRV